MRNNTWSEMVVLHDNREGEGKQTHVFFKAVRENVNKRSWFLSL